jgi:RNA polymerase sigma-70 factor (ECF subfamily)
MITTQVRSALKVSRQDNGSASTADAELIERIAAADTQAMRALTTRYNVRVFRYVLRMINDRTLAEDVVSETFFEVWQYANRFKRRAKVLTWILAVARHKAMSALRHHRVHEDLDAARDIADPAENAEALWFKADRANIIRHCLAKLSWSHREVLDLFYYHEQPIESVVRIIGVPLNTVKTRMFYGRKRLAAFLAEAGIDRVAI